MSSFSALSLLAGDRQNHGPGDVKVLPQKF